MDRGTDVQLTYNSSVCKLCLQEPEDQAHFIVRCPRLEAVRSQLLLTATPHCSRNSITSTNLLELQTWINNHMTQKFAIDYLHNLCLYRNSLLSRSH